MEITLNQETVTDGNGTGLKLSYKVANIFNITGDSTYSVTLTQGKNNNNVDNDNYKYEIERTSGSYSLAVLMGTTGLSGDFILQFKKSPDNVTNIVGIDRDSTRTNTNNLDYYFLIYLILDIV